MSEQTKLNLAKALYSMSMSSEKEGKANHKFWNTQPVPQAEREPDKHGEIETKKVEDIRKDPLRLPSGFIWCSVDITDEKQVGEVYKLLSENYVEDDYSTFRFDYSREFLQWALTPPDYIEDFHVGVRGKKNGKLYGFITGIPASVQVYKTEKKMVEINFLCVHKKLRSKRLAPVLIREITRRVNLTDVWQAVYTAGKVLPMPVAHNRYWHRSLNPRKLINIGFSQLQPLMTIGRTVKLYQLPNTPQIPGLRAYNPSTDAKKVHTLLTNFLAKFKLHPKFTVDETAHWFTPREGVVYAYVVEGGNGKITDLISFYSLPSTILNHKKYKTLRAAYGFYNVASEKTGWEKLMNDALILAQKAKFDVFNILDVMENEKFFKELKFARGDGNLQYYIYNWNCPVMKPSDVGLVLM
mmetsp:Transcript_27113/g.52564  ORF Transcript_27113/g.52564 Transcript_27113/m.52564 type:complete len:411 (-) Transcript_27113:180-1412(-)